MNRDEYVNGVLRKRWDDTVRVYTEFNAAGVQTLQRSYTQAEIDRATASALSVTERTNKQTLEQQATTALADNRTFLAIASPTQAQTLTQVKALTRQNNAIMRLILNKLDGTN